MIPRLAGIPLPAVLDWEPRPEGRDRGVGAQTDQSRVPAGGWRRVNFPAEIPLAGEAGFAQALFEDRQTVMTPKRLAAKDENWHAEDMVLGRRAQPSSVSRSSIPRLKGAIGLPVRISLLPPIGRTLADHNLFNAFATHDTRLGSASRMLSGVIKAGTLAYLYARKASRRLAQFQAKSERDR